MTLPAHRFRDRQAEDRKKKDKDGRTWTFDFDETITKAPDQCARIAEGLQAVGDKVVVVTGNESPRDQLVGMLKDYKFPFDQLIQYHDDNTDGINRAAILDQLDAFGAFDDRAGRGVTLGKVCPHFFLIAKPPKMAKDRASSKKKAKKLAKDARDDDQPVEERDE